MSNTPKPNGKEDSPWPGIVFILGLAALVLIGGIWIATLIVAFPK